MGLVSRGSGMSSFLLLGVWRELLGEQEGLCEAIKCEEKGTS